MQETVRDHQEPLDIDINSLPAFQRPLHMDNLVVAEKPSALNLGDFRGENYIGAFAYLNQESIIYSSVVGRYTSIGHKVMIGATEHPANWLSTHPFTYAKQSAFSPCPEYDLICTDEDFPPNDRITFIGNDVWIGYGVYIRRGVTIGDGAVIGAGAVVTKDVEPYTIVGGTPAKLIRPRFDADIVARMQKLQWWNYILDKRRLPGIQYADLPASLGQLEEAVSNGKLEIFAPEKIAFKRKGHNLVVQQFK